MIKLLDAQIKDLQNFGVDKNNKFLIIAIDEFTDIINIERIGDKESLFIEAVDLLPSDDCRYLLLNYSDNNSTKVLFFKWIPDISKIKRKMMYSGFSNNIRVCILSVYGTNTPIPEYVYVRTSQTTFL